jgi:hypothetical protein
MSNPIVYLVVVAAAFLIAGLVKGVTGLALPTVGVGLLSLAVHADEAAFETQITLPAKFDRRFHRDPRAGRAKDRLLVGGVLLLEEQAARHGDDRRRDALLLENVPRLDREMQF